MAVQGVQGVQLNPLVLQIQKLTDERVVEIQRVQSLCGGAQGLLENYSPLLTSLDRRIGLLMDRRERQRESEDLLTVNFEHPGKGGISITVFFPENTSDYQAVHAATLRILDTRCCVGAIYAYEQKGTSMETIGHNPHVHIFVPNTHRKSWVIRDVYRVYQRLVNSEASVHVELKPPTWFRHCQGYLAGRKSSAKMPAVAYDGRWRDIVGLPHPKETAQSNS